MKKLLKLIGNIRFSLDSVSSLLRSLVVLAVVCAGLIRRCDR